MKGRKPCLPAEIDEHDFSALLRKEKHARVKMRLLGLLHLQKGKSYTQVSEILQVERSAPQRWVKRLARGGISALMEQSGRGRKRKLKAAEEALLCEKVTQLREQRKGGRTRAKDIQKLLYENFGVNYVLSSIYPLLHRVGMSWITARSRHPEADIEAQEAFKKTLLQRLNSGYPKK